MDATTWIVLTVISCILLLIAIIYRAYLACRVAEVNEKLDQAQLASDKVVVYTDSQGNVVRVTRVISTGGLTRQVRPGMEPPIPPASEPPENLGTPLLASKV